MLITAPAYKSKPWNEGSVSLRVETFLIINCFLFLCLTLLFRYDGALTGCAVSVFITAAHTGGNESDDLISALNSKGLAIAAVLSVVSGVVHMACRNMNDLPALTLSFNICTLCFLLSLTDQQSDLTSLGWGPSDDDFLKDPSHWGSAQTIGWYHDAIVRGVGQFHFVHTTLGGWFVIIGIAISSRWAAATTVLGSFIGCITARYIMVVPDASLHMVRNGLYGYSSAGTCCAIAGGVFYHKNFYSLGFAIFGAGFTVLIKTAVDALLISDGLQLPSLTIPFVVTTWLIMLCKSAWLDSIAGEGEDMDDVRFVNLNNDTYGDVVKKLLEKNTNTSWKGHDAGQMQRRGSVEKLVLKRVDSIRSMIPSPSISRENSFSVFTPKGIGKAPSFGSGTPQGLGRVHSFSTPTGIGKSPSFTTPKAAPGSGRSAGQGVGTTPTRLGNAQGLGGSFDPARAQAMGVGTVPTRLGNAQGLGGSFDPARARAMGIGSSSSRRVYVEAFSPDSDSDDDQTPPAGTPAGAGASAGASSGASSGARMGAGVGVSHGNGPGLSLSSDDDAGSESKRSVGGSSSAEWAATGRNAGRGSGRAYNSSDGNSSSNRDSEQNLYSSEGAAADADAVSSMTADEHHPDRVIPFPDQTT